MSRFVMKLHEWFGSRKIYNVSLKQYISGGSGYIYVTLKGVIAYNKTQATNIAKEIVLERIILVTDDVKLLAKTTKPITTVSSFNA